MTADEITGRSAFRSMLCAHVRAALVHYTEPISTTTLVAAITPGASREAQIRTAKLLPAMAVRELADCARRGPVEIIKIRGYGGKWISKRREPWLWYLYGTPNDEARRCPHCGGLV